MRFVLRPRDGSSTYHKITQGRSWVGRVYQHAETGKWHGIMYKGKYESHDHSTPEEAFHQVAALALGFDSPAAIRAHNSLVRAQRAASKQRARTLVNDYLRTGDVGPLVDTLLGKK